MERDELAGWLRLTLTPGVGNESSRKLLAAFGLPHAIFAQPLAALSQVVSGRQAAQLKEVPPELAALLDTTWDWLVGGPANPADPASPADGGTPPRSIVALGDSGYPGSLLNMDDPPLMLYLLGGGSLAPTSLAQSVANSVAIVGSRNPTAQGLINARQFAHALSAAGVTVVSGLALGIDGAAHAGALEGFGIDVGPSTKSAAKSTAKSASAQAGADRLATIAVVGTGLDRVYPKSHRALAHAIANNGLIISEYPLGTPPLAANFPKRNRLIAGLTQGTLVVEAALKSGSLITARLAAEQGKEVFAIPGSIQSIHSRGCHSLIRQGAKLVESPEDILEDLKLIDAIIVEATYAYNTGATGTFDRHNGQNTPPTDPPERQDGLADPAGADAALLAALGFDPVSLDALQARTGIDTPRLQAQLMALELDSLVARLPGGLFQRMGQA